MLRTFVVILICVGALVVFWIHKPEQVFSRSENGVVTVEGVSGTVRSVSIESAQEFAEAIFPGRVGDYYLLNPNPSGVTMGSDVKVRILEQWKPLVKNLTDFSLYRFDVETRAWNTLPTLFDLSQGEMTTHIDLSGPTWIVVGKK